MKLSGSSDETEPKKDSNDNKAANNAVLRFTDRPDRYIPYSYTELVIDLSGELEMDTSAGTFDRSIKASRPPMYKNLEVIILVGLFLKLSLRKTRKNPIFSTNIGFFTYMAAPYSEISNYFQDATYSLCDHDQSC